jgi:hypothetical protein
MKESISSVRLFFADAKISFYPLAFPLPLVHIAFCPSTPREVPVTLLSNARPKPNIQLLNVEAFHRHNVVDV